MKMYEGVLARVREIEKKRGIKYATTDGNLYKALRILYTVTAIWVFLMNLFFVLGFVIMYSGTDNMSEALNSIITVSACTLCIIAGYVLNCVKLHIPSLVLNVVPSCFLIPVFASFLKDSLGFLGFKASFYWRHGVPLVLLVLFIVWLSVIALRAKVKTEKQYKKVTENLFSIYNVNSEENVTAEQWEEFLQNYDPAQKNNVNTEKQALNEG